jgi:serine/threonine protein kinase
MNDLLLLKQIGIGKSSKIFMAKDIKSGLLFSLKCLKKEQIIKENMINQITREIKIGSYCRHPNIISFYGFFDDVESFYLLS